MSVYALILGSEVITLRNRDNRVLRFINRVVDSQSAEFILVLYLAPVRPHLDYSVQFWYGFYRGDIDPLKSVQRKITTMI